MSGLPFSPTERFVAPGKLMWMGEYAVLDGAPALVAAVDRGVVVSIAPAAERECRVWVHGVAGVQTPDDGVLLHDARGQRWPNGVPAGYELLAAGIRAVLGPEMTCGWQSSWISIDSSALASAALRDGGAKLGLGSSGAVAAGWTALLAQQHGIPVEQWLDIARVAHDSFQGGVGSGADVCASMLGGVVRMEAGAAARIADPDIAWAAIWTGQSADTRSMIAALRTWRKSAGTAADVLLRDLGEIGRQAINALEAHDVDGWLAGVSAFAAQEARITHASGVPILNAPVTRAMEAARAAGWTSKPSGAGGGDVVVAFAPAGTSFDGLDAACAAAGVQRIPLALDLVGVQRARSAARPHDEPVEAAPTSNG